MRLSLSLSIVLALLVAPLAACEFHAETGHAHHPEPATTGPTVSNPAAAPATPAAPAPTSTTEIKTGHVHLTASDAGV